MTHRVIFSAIYSVLVSISPVLLIIAAYYVYRIYTRRHRESAAQAKMQALINDIAAHFSLAGEESVTQPIHELLMKLAGYYKAEIVLIHAIDNEFSHLINTQYYSKDKMEISPEQRMLCMERWEDYLLQHSNKPGAALCEEEAIREKFKDMKNVPWFFIPICKKEKAIGFLYIESADVGFPWTEEQFAPLPILSRIVSDALEKKISEMRITFMAYYDSLTKLPNRRLFHDRTDQAIRLARRANKTVGIVYLDLDSFKSINDTVGHEGGDRIIQDIGQKLANGLRNSDTVARFGGDEFLILLNSVADVDDISKVVDKIMRIFKEPILLKGQEIFVTASAGVSVYPVDGEDADTLIKHADIAMCTAKEKGKSRYVFCSSNMKEAVKYRMNLSNTMYRALERNQLQVFYQPKIDLQTEKIIGSEALLRWFHPDYGMIPPNEFIPLAEQSGLINSIGNWVLETACMQTVAWKEMGLGELRIAVNLSVVQLRNPNFVAQVERILQKTGIDPHMVELEITESTMTKEPDYIIGVLNDLKDLGISISIDDFGTEYSSLNRLKMLPIDSLKMDIQFVQGIGKSSKDQAITLVIMSLAKNLDLKLVAEGVENSTQRDFLKSRMCDEVQGFYYYKPMPAAEIEKILS